MDMPTLRRTEYYNLMSVINAVSADNMTRRALFDDLGGHLEFGDGDTVIRLVYSGTLAEVWMDTGMSDLAEKALDMLGPVALINLEG